MPEPAPRRMLPRMPFELVVSLLSGGLFAVFTASALIVFASL